MTRTLIEREAIDNSGQLYYFNTKKEGYLFETTIEDNTLSYLTKWSPNTQVMVEVADHFGLNYNHWYDEQGMQIYGMDSYQAGHLSEVSLDESDFSLYTYNEQNDCYWFEGQSYTTEEDTMETLLSRKLSILDLLNPK